MVKVMDINDLEEKTSFKELDKATLDDMLSFSLKLSRKLFPFRSVRGF